ncbi:MAG TPA: protein translocase subunit SecF [Smithellaceae bacterium]|nr:protein translocase subunit SecF [Smithellaceae bacterium]HRS89723.1 protein translocase subunit SecF [Smithellaceae bacterium]HRV26857.1 protein translocase subunit SecF [Smithellaceae bacterium]
MMELIKPGINIDFVGKLKYALVLSSILIIIGIGSIIYHGGLNPGIDFAGGTIIQIKFQKDVSADQIRGALQSTKLASSIIQQFGAKEFLIRTHESFSDQQMLAANVQEPLTSAFNQDYEIRRVEVVGSKVGADFTRKAIIAVILSWIAILIYVAWRFEFRYAMGGILALIHDTLIVIGAISVMNMEFTISILAAVIFVIGFSINDTIVTLDRIKEIVKKHSKQKLSDIINSAINQTLSRTILTSLTVFFTVLALYIFGGAVIRDFAFALLIGTVVGTYSTIYIACTSVLFFEKLQPVKTKRTR